jgi:HD-GYP domain-containing protein (c-di-GMP phosphodiesterase class II)
MSSDHPSGDPSPAAEPAPQAAEVERIGLPLLAALDAHLPGARRHADATGAYAAAAALELGLSRERVELVREIARLHDVGMVYVPAEILRRPLANLSSDEQALLESHIEAGSRLARGAGIPDRPCEWILHTRERWDGTGPERLVGEMIPLEARIIRAACAADIVLATHGREQAIEALRTAAGEELDPRATGAVVGVLERTAQAKGPAR